MLQNPWQASCPRLKNYHSKHLGFWLWKRCQEGSHTFLSCCFHFICCCLDKVMDREKVCGSPCILPFSIAVGKNLLFNDKKNVLRTMEITICNIARAKSGQGLILPQRQRGFAGGWWNKGPRGTGTSGGCMSLPSPRPSWCPHPDLENCRTLDLTLRNLRSAGGGRWCLCLKEVV